MYKYKLKEEHLQNGERIFPGIGTTKEGFIQSNSPIESPVLDLVSGPEDQKPTEQPAPTQPAAPQQPPTNKES